MARKAFVISAILIVIVIIVSIVISIVSIVNTKPVVFRTVVTYNAETNAIIESPHSRTAASSNDLPFLTGLLNHEKTIMISSLFAVLIFALLFYGAKRSKS